MNDVKNDVKEVEIIMFSRISKRIFPLTLALLLTLSAVPAARAAGFSDVPGDHWAYAYIQDVAARGLIQGSGGRFRPDDPVSVQAFLSMVCRASGLDDRKLQSGADWADPAIAYGQYFGWFTAEEMGDRTAPISREFAAQLLVNAFHPEAVGQGDGLHFQDEREITESRVPYVQAAVELGLIHGYEDGSFRPQEGLTRAAAAKLLSLCLPPEPQPTGAQVQVPVLMYHDVSYLGHGYSKTPEIFEKQMRELKDAGFHTVFFSELIDYVENGTPLPEKPIVISIDDGYATNYTYVYPILQELGMKAEISIIGDAIRYTNWGLSWDQIREMVASGLVSIQPHTSSLHSDANGRIGMLKKSGESWMDYVQLVGDDTRTILDLITQQVGVQPQVFTYPHGKHNAMTEAIVQRLGCQVSLTTKDGVAVVVQGDPASLRLMDRIGMDFRNGSVVSTLKQFGYKG